MRKDSGKATAPTIPKSTTTPQLTTVSKQSADNADSSSCANEALAIMNTINLNLVSDAYNDTVDSFSCDLNPPIYSQQTENKVGAEQLHSQLEFVQTENEILKSELGLAQDQIFKLKKSLANVRKH